MHLYDVVIVGGGAAGLNAALILGRARRSVLVCDDGCPRNAVAEQMHGFLSRDCVPPATLLEIAHRELRNYPSVKVLKTRIVSAEPTKAGFVLTSQEGDRYSGKRLLLANGVQDILPSIEGLADFWGRSVFVCPFCDGWEVQDQSLAVLGTGKESIALAQELYGWSKHVFICAENTEGITSKQRRWLELTHCRLIEKPVKRLVGQSGSLEAVEFDDGERLLCSALFLTTPLRQACDIAKLLGCRINKQGAIVVDEECRTNVPRCYAAGDAASTLHQVILAAASGVRAAVAICAELLCEEADDIIESQQPAKVS